MTYGIEEGAAKGIVTAVCPAMGEPMNIGELCQRNVVYSYRHVVLSEAARLMREQHVGSIVVVDETDRGRIPVGMLTDRDIVVAVVARDLDARTLSVADAMSGDPATVRDDSTIADTLRLMRRRGVRRVPVVSRDGALVGIVALDDVLGSLAQELGELAGAIQGEVGHERWTRS